MDNIDQQLGGIESSTDNGAEFNQSTSRFLIFNNKIIEYAIVVLLTLITIGVIYYVTREHLSLIIFFGVILTVTVLLTRGRKNGYSRGDRP